MKKRVFSVLMTVAVTFGALPSDLMTVYGEDNPVEYSRKEPEVAVLNAATGNNSEIYKDIKGSTSGEEEARAKYYKYNAVGLYKKEDESEATYDDSADDTVWSWNSQSYGDYKDTVLNSLADISKNLEISLSAELYNKTHNHTKWNGLIKITSTVTAYETVRMITDGYVQSYRGCDYLEYTHPRVGGFSQTEEFYRYLGTGTGENGLIQFSSPSVEYTDTEKRNCNCAVYAEKVVVTYRDTRAPKLTEIEYSTDGGKTFSKRFGQYCHLGKNKELIIKLTYDEPIRFADDSAEGKNKLYLDLQASASSTGKNKAYLKKLEDSSLYFSYTNTRDTEETISVIDMNSLFGNNLKLVQVSGGESFAIDKEIKQDGSTDGISTSKCYITDLAGNALTNESIGFPNLTVDSKAPEVKDITIKRNLNNADIKEYLGKDKWDLSIAEYERDYADKSDEYLGVGDSFLIYATMSEALNISAEKTGAAAWRWYNTVFTTNIKVPEGYSGKSSVSTLGRDSDGYLTVASVTLNPTTPNRSKASEINTGAVTITADMEVPPEGILVTKTEFTNGTVTDLAGNAYTETEVPKKVNSNPPKVDITPPSVTDSDYTKDGDGFSYKVQLSDTESTCESIPGSFVLNNGGDGKAYKYKYAVTAAPETTSDTEWLTGITGEAQTMKQTVPFYIHIQPDGDENYADLTACTLTICARDYAGNTGETVLPKSGSLAWYIDNLEPNVSVGSSSRKLNGSGGGTLTVGVKLTDSSGISAWQYAWSDSNTEEPKTGWENGTVTATSTSDPVDVSLTKTVDGSEAFDKYLWVKATDNSDMKNTSKTAVCVGRYSYDMTDAEYTLNYSAAVQNPAAIGVEDIGENDTLIFMLETTAENLYYVYKAEGSSDFSAIENVFAGSSWLPMTVTEENGVYSFTRAVSPGDGIIPSQIAAGNYNGNLTVRVLSGKTSAVTTDISGTLTAAGNEANVFAAETVSLRAASATAVNLRNQSISTSNARVNAVSTNKRWSEGSETCLSTLAGVAFEVYIGDDLRGWNYDDVDWANSGVQVTNITKNKDYDKIALTPGVARQTITIPEAEYETGFYRVSLHVECLSGKNYDTYFMPLKADYIVVDATDPSNDFGLSSVIYTPRGNCGTKNYNIFDIDTYYGTRECVSGDRDDIILPISKWDASRSVYGATEGTYLFTIESPEESKAGELDRVNETPVYTGQYYVKMWNTATNDAVTLYPHKDDQRIIKNEDYDDDNQNLRNNGDVKFTFDKNGNGLYLEPEKTNVIAVQKFYSNGKTSDIKYVQIKPQNKLLGGKISADGDDKQLIFTPDESSAALSADATVYAWTYQNENLLQNDSSSLKDNHYLKGGGTAVPMTLQQDGTWRCALSENGAEYNVISITEDGCICEVGHIEQRAPWFTNLSLTALDDPKGLYADSAPSGIVCTPNKIGEAGDENGTYTLQFAIRDDYNTIKNGMTVDIDIDELGHHEFTYKGESNYEWYAQEPNSNGIYKVTAELTQHSPNSVYRRDVLNVTVEGRYPKNDTMKAVVTARDAFGNTSVTDKTEFESKYKDAEIIQLYQCDKGLGVVFNQPVRPTESWAWNESDDETGRFAEKWEGAFPVTADGEQTFEFCDVFGNNQKITKNVDVFGDYGMNVTISDEKPTTDDVTVNIKSVENQKTAFGDNDPSMDENSVTLSENDTVHPKLYKAGDDSLVYELRVHITNIAKAAPKAELRYYIHSLGEEFTESELKEYIDECGGSLTVTGNISVWYRAERDVTATEGGDEFIFTPGGEMSHTFKYKDSVGFEGSITATLPSGISLVSPSEKSVDTKAPFVNVGLYAKRFGSYEEEESFLPEDTEKESTEETSAAARFGNLSYVQGYRLKINASDESGYIIELSGADGGSIPDGVTLNGNIVTIDKPVSFKVIVTDKSVNKNATVFAVTADMTKMIDNTAPTAEIETVSTGMFSKKLIAVLSDKDDSGNLTVSDSEDTVTLSIPTDAKKVGINKYEYDVTDNGDVSFVFYDRAGNRNKSGDATVKISGIDTKPPELSLYWSPSEDGKYNEETKRVEGGVLTKKKVNTNVTAIIESNKMLSGLQVKLGDDWSAVLSDSESVQTKNPMILTDSDNNEMMKITASANRITVTYMANLPEIEIKATSPNGKSTSVHMPAITVIDKDAPKITVTKKELFREKSPNENYSVPYAVQYKLTPNEGNVTSPNYGLERIGADLTQYFYSPEKPMEKTFRANGTYNIQFVDSAGNMTTESIVVDNLDNTAPEIVLGEKTESGRSVSVPVTVNEDCTVTAAEKTYSFKSGVAQILTFTDNGTFLITAVDNAGNESSKSVSVGSIDKILPSLSFTNSTIYLMSGSSAETLKTALDSGYTAWDDIEEDGYPTVEIDSDAVDLNNAGLYKVYYTVTDKAQNSIKATRFVSVIGKDTVCAEVDGCLVMPNSTMILRPGEHNLTLRNCSEPYTVKARSGIRSTGQMKYLTGGSLSFDENGTFGITQPGYYTVLITTQSRQTICIRLYVEK